MTATPVGAINGQHHRRNDILSRAAPFYSWVLRGTPKNDRKDTAGGHSGPASAARMSIAGRQRLHTQSREELFSGSTAKLRHDFDVSPFTA